MSVRMIGEELAREAGRRETTAVLDAGQAGIEEAKASSEYYDTGHKALCPVSVRATSPRISRMPFKP